MMPQLLGREPSRRQEAWMPLECFVPADDRFHLALPMPQEESLDWGSWLHTGCRLACPCEVQPADSGPRGGACMALPVLSSDRDQSDTRNLQLQAEGLDR